MCSGGKKFSEEVQTLFCLTTFKVNHRILINILLESLNRSGVTVLKYCPWPVIEIDTFNYLIHCPCIMYHNYALDTMCWDKHTTFETNNLIQSNRSVFLLMQNYSQVFFQTEISDVIFAAVFAICCRPLQFDN